MTVAKDPCDNMTIRFDPDDMDFLDPNIVRKFEAFMEELAKETDVKGARGELLLLKRIKEAGDRVVLYSNPSTTGSGIDAAFLNTKTGMVEFFDNKAYDDFVKVADSSALENLEFDVSKQAPTYKLADKVLRGNEELADSMIAKLESEQKITKEMATQARRSLKAGSYTKYISGAGGKVIGVTPRMRQLGMEFWKPGNAAALRAARRAAIKSGDKALARKLGAALGVFLAGAATVWKLYQAYTNGKQFITTLCKEGLEPALVEFFDNWTGASAVAIATVDLSNAITKYFQDVRDSKEAEQMMATYGVDKLYQVPLEELKKEPKLLQQATEAFEDDQLRRLQKGS
jgi:hypothetical protein